MVLSTSRSKPPEPLAPAGLPRPRARWAGDPRKNLPAKTLPVPWLVARVDPDDPADWTLFDDERCTEAHDQQLCQVCGLTVGRDTVILAALSAADERRISSGPATHPGCALLAVRHCPHFHGWDPDAPVGWLYQGDHRGYQLPPPPVDDDPDGYVPDALFTDDVVAHPDATPVTVADLRQLAASSSSEDGG